jgi:hypothetical protein
MIELIDITDPNAQLTSRIIATMLHSDRTIPEIADEFRLSFAAMMALLETPHAKAEIEAIGKLNALRDQLRAPIRREGALHRLAHIVAYGLNEPEARRAATTLIKAQTLAQRREPEPHDAPKTQSTTQTQHPPEAHTPPKTQVATETQPSPPGPMPSGTPSLREGAITTSPAKPRKPIPTGVQDLLPTRDSELATHHCGASPL